MKVWAAAALMATSATETERLRGFDAVAAAGERVEMAGFGAGERTRFRLGAAGGWVERGSTRIRWGRERVAQAALRFSISGPDLNGELAGECHADEAAVRDHVERSVAVTTTVGLPRVACRFTIDGRPSGALELGEQPARNLTVIEERRGSLTWADRQFAVRSVHHFAGSRWPAGAPLGYLIEDAGVSMAGVDNSRTRRVLFLPRSGETRTAALAATAALALMWKWKPDVD